jgi:hypothetical protein
MVDITQTEIPSNPQVIDPDNISETLCDGVFNIHIIGGLAYLTFTHLRPTPEQLFAGAKIEPKSVVRARIVTSVPNLIALKDILNRLLVENIDITQSTTATGGTLFRQALSSHYILSRPQFFYLRPINRNIGPIMRWRHAGERHTEAGGNLLVEAGSDTPSLNAKFPAKDRA